jgi:hypothetical protein
MGCSASVRIRVDGVIQDDSPHEPAPIIDDRQRDKIAPLKERGDVPQRREGGDAVRLAVHDHVHRCICALRENGVER